MKEKINAVSLFSSAGIGELRLPPNINVTVANELLPQRAECYSFFYPTVKMICGDISSTKIKKEIILQALAKKCKLLIATPPCQGLSTLGKNKGQAQYEADERNFLVLETFDIIDVCDFNYIIIENVPKFIEMMFPWGGAYYTLEQILRKKYGTKYQIEIKVLNAKNYGIPQSRPRAIIKMWKRNLSWAWPLSEPEINLRTAIGHLPSLEPGQDSGIPWHYAKPQNPRAVLAMRHTASGKSAIANKVYYPKKADVIEFERTQFI